MYFNFSTQKWLSFFLHFLLFVYFAKAISSTEPELLNQITQPITQPDHKRFVIMTRHGETEWSKDNRFCGWFDSPLTKKGKQQGKDSGELLKNAGFQFEKAYTSVLSRASDSLNIILETIGQKDLPVTISRKLIERHYGDLTGHRKGEFLTDEDKKKLEQWRRGYDVLPPPITEANTAYYPIRNNEAIKIPLMADGVKFPDCESLKTTKERVAPFWDDVIKPEIENENRVLIVAHGTVLRALVTHIEQLTEEQSGLLEIPTAVPFIYEFNSDMKLLKPMVFLGDPKEIQDKINENKLIKLCPVC